MMTKKDNPQKNSTSVRGILIDIESIERLRKRPLRSAAHFYRKIFTAAELAYCRTYKDPYPHLAARFCAKEAAVKALGMAPDFKKIEVRKNAQTGAPFLFVKGKNLSSAYISLSHTRDYACALVVIF